MNELNRQSRELASIRQELIKAINYIHDAEGEIPESMRRFVNYFHDLHDIKFVYEELGHAAPAHILRELERCDDRFRQLVTKHHTDGGVFEKVRREMAADPENRWDHTRELFYNKPEEKADETRQSEQGRYDGEEGTDPPQSQPGSGRPNGPIAELQEGDSLPREGVQGSYRRV